MTRRHLLIRVDCYSGYRRDEEPRGFHVDAGRVDVVQIEDRWLTPTHRYFKVKGDDGALYTLRHHVLSDTWELEETGTS